MGDEKKESGLIELAGLWINQAESGMKYFAGKLNGLNIVIMKNKYKEEGTNQPDYKMFLSKPRKREEQDDTI